MLRSLGTGSVGLGVTVASTFAPALGLSLTQQRIGFACGVALIILGAIFFYLDRKRSNLGDQLNSQMRDGQALLAELTAPAKPEGGPGNWSLEFGDAPQEWHDKAEDFFERSKELLVEQHIALLEEFEAGYNERCHKQRERLGKEPDVIDARRSTAENVLAFANATQRGPALKVEATLSGLAAARRQWGAEVR